MRGECTSHSLGRAFVRAYVEIRDYKYVFMILHYYIFIFDAIIFDNQIMASAPTHSSPGGISDSI